MEKRKNYLLTGLVAILLFAMCSMLLVFAPTTEAAAEEDLNSICAKYTNSDRLLDSNGLETEETIDNITDRLRFRQKLDMIIPSQCMQVSTPAGTIYQYVGLEYGFVVRHTQYKKGDTTYKAMKILVFDIEYYDIDHHPDHVQQLGNNQFGLGIATLYSDTLAYKNLYGVEMWTDPDVGYLSGNLELCNVSFINTLYNENELNYGDSKVIIFGIVQYDQKKYAAGNEVGRVFTDSPQFDPEATNNAVVYAEIDDRQCLTALIEQINQRRNLSYETGD